MTLLEKIAKLEKEIATLRYAVQAAERGGTIKFEERGWASVGAVIRAGVLPALRAVRGAVTSRETAERRAHCRHTDVRFYHGSTDGRCRGCRQPMTRDAADIPVEERRDR